MNKAIFHKKINITTSVRKVQHLSKKQHIKGAVFFQQSNEKFINNIFLSLLGLHLQKGYIALDHIFVDDQTWPH